MSVAAAILLPLCHSIDTIKFFLKTCHIALFKQFNFGSCFVFDFSSANGNVNSTSRKQLRSHKLYTNPNDKRVSTLCWWLDMYSLLRYYNLHDEDDHGPCPKHCDQYLSLNSRDTESFNKAMESPISFRRMPKSNFTITSRIHPLQ